MHDNSLKGPQERNKFYTNLNYNLLKFLNWATGKLCVCIFGAQFVNISKRV